MVDSHGPPIEDAGFLIEAFQDLSTMRNNGPIPFNEIAAYADRYGLPEDFVFSMRELDKFYVEKSVGAAEAKNSKEGAGAKTSQEPSGRGIGPTSERGSVPRGHTGLDSGPDPVGAQVGGGRR